MAIDYEARCKARDAHRRAVSKLAPELVTALRELMNYVGGWDETGTHPCAIAAATLAKVDALDGELAKVLS